MIGSLTARIFAIFWLTLALVLMLVLMLPKLDSRQMTELLESEQRQGIMIEQHVEAELANDPPNDLMWWRRLFRAIDKWAPPGQRLLLVTSEGRVIGAERNEMQIIRNFIGQADNADHPQKKRYGRLEIVGPFSVRDGEDNYQLYLIRPASTSQSDFINLEPGSDAGTRYPHPGASVRGLYARSSEREWRGNYRHFANGLPHRVLYEPDWYTGRAARR